MANLSSDVQCAIINKDVNAKFDGKCYRLLSIDQVFNNDFNGRPQIFVNNNLVLRTHPFYCFSGTHYGRVYRFETIDDIHLDIHIYDEYNDLIIAELDPILESLGQNYREFTIGILKFTHTEEPYGKLINKMHGEMVESKTGCVQYRDNVWLIEKIDEKPHCNYIQYYHDDFSFETVKNVILKFAGDDMEEFIRTALVGWVTRYRRDTNKWHTIGAVFSKSRNIHAIIQNHQWN